MLERAAILIGVKKTGGGLATLRAVGSGLEAMWRWADSQRAEGMKTITVLSDANDANGKASDQPVLREVTADHIKDAIKDAIDDGIEQLLVYFAGHGAALRYSEYWLLSGAPDDADEAVNVQGSASRARQSGIPHVIFISDACRTAAASTQAQGIEGSIVFPNKEPSLKPGCVDVFYACIVGKASNEIENPAEAAKFEAIYTTSLVEGLNGKGTVDIEKEGTRRVRLVRPWSLKRYLDEAVPARLSALNAPLAVNQSPDAIIASPPEWWIAMLDAEAGRRRAPISNTEEVVATPGPGPASIAAASRSAVQTALRGAQAGAPARGARPRRVRGARTPQEPSVQMFDELLQRSGSEAPGALSTHCGFRVTGTAVVEAITSAKVELDRDKGIVEVSAHGGPGANVLLVFEDGSGALLAAIPEFIGLVSYEGGELANVAYEPSGNSSLHNAVMGQMDELRALRQVIATATRLGTFRLDDVADRNALIDRMRAVKCLAPTLAVYAAYALQLQQQTDVIADMQTSLRGSLGMSLFDVAMLARAPGGAPQAMPPDVFPALPMLAQGWTVIDAFGVKLPASLGTKNLQRHVRNSLWTHFDEQGVSIVREAITAKEIS